MNFSSTLSIFPSYKIGIVKSQKHFLIPEKWFCDIVTLLTFNVFVLIGNLVSTFINVSKFLTMWFSKYMFCLKIKRPLLFTLVWCRAFALFAFFVLCNYRPEKRRFPALIQNDYIYWLGNCVFSFTFGLLTCQLLTLK